MPVVLTGLFISYITLLTETAYSKTSCGNLTAESKAVAEGTNVVLQLYMLPGKKNVTWQRETNPLQYIDLYINEVYEIMVSETGIHHQLIIIRSKWNNTGNYRVKCKDGYSNVVNVIIAPVPPTKPIFSDISSIHSCNACIPALISKRISVQCYTEGGSEPVNLYMLKNGENITNITALKEEIEYHGKIKRIRSYVFTPLEGEKDHTFTCTVENPALQRRLEESAKVYVHVPPKRIEMKGLSVKENKPSDIQCVTHLGRPPLQPSFYIRGYKQNSSEMTFVAINRTFSVSTILRRRFTIFENNADVFCCVFLFEKLICEEHEQYLNVAFPPSVVNLTEVNKTNAGDGDTELSLNCSTDPSNPRSQLMWSGIDGIRADYRGQIDRFDNATNSWSSSSIVHLKLTKLHNRKEIVCTAMALEFIEQNISASYVAEIYYAPIVTIPGEENRTVYVGDTVVLHCLVDSNPESNITWFSEIDKIKEVTVKDTLATIRIHNVSQNNSQMYTCEATNGIGNTSSRSVNLHLAVREATDRTAKIPITNGVLLLLIGSVAVSVTMLVFLVISKQISRRRRNGKSKEENMVRTTSVLRTSASPDVVNEAGTAEYIGLKPLTMRKQNDEDYLTIE